MIREHVLALLQNNRATQSIRPNQTHVRDQALLKYPWSFQGAIEESQQKGMLES